MKLKAKVLNYDLDLNYDHFLRSLSLGCHLIFVTEFEELGTGIF
jgi:hypothetical protein